MGKGAVERLTSGIGVRKAGAGGKTAKNMHHTHSSTTSHPYSVTSYAFLCDVVLF